jgi:hypothetical protein
MVKKVFEDLTFSLNTHTSFETDDLESEIESNGGTISKSVTKKVFRDYSTCSV